MITDQLAQQIANKVNKEWTYGSRFPIDLLKIRDVSNGHVTESHPLDQIIIRELAKHKITPTKQKPPLCTHGTPMNQRCAECDKWLHEHLNREAQNPRQG